ncbi:hypothetical protein NW760_013784 [Fusarium oxysporum]|nr:hypothetical protein NW769_013671 [Fusarium oxysporum]KAJ4216620.1 hypothetical protein NW760_013784 [Fusarium oxysporum]
MPAPPPSFVVNTNPERVAESQTALIIGVIAAVNLLALVVVAARTYTRLAISKSPGAQDVLMVLSACTGLVGTIILFMQISYGLGKHADTIERPDYATFGKYSFIHTVVSLLGGIGLLKIAIALELIKYNGNSGRWYNITLWCLIGQPFSPTCRHNEVVDYPAFNIFTDVAFATLPIPIVWSLKMPLKTRIYLVVVLSLGYIAAVMGLVKAISQIKYDPAGDTTYLYDVQFWGLLQLNVGTIAACVPSLRPLVKNILRLKSLTPVYGYTNSGQRQRSMPLSTIGVGGAKSTSRRGQPAFEPNDRHDRKNGLSSNAGYGDTVFELKNSSQVAILETDSTERR